MMNHPIAEIFSQGEEVVRGQVTDTNASWLSQELVQIGFMVSRHTAVGDKLADLISVLIEVSQRADFCICTGGLGPTVDDLTAEAVAKAFNCPLQLDTVALAQIEHYFANRKRKMADINRKQAYLPKGAIRIDNAWGTAPGFALQYQRCWFVFVPGVPQEMKQLFNEHIKADLQQRFKLKIDKLITIRTVGTGESELQQKLNDFDLPVNVQLSFRAATDEVQTKLLFPANVDVSMMNDCVNQLTEIIGDSVYAVDESGKSSSSLMSVINQLMNQKEYTLAVIETASCGLIAAKSITLDGLQQSRTIHNVNSFLNELNITKADSVEETAIAISKAIKQKYNSALVLVQMCSGDKKQFQDKESSLTLYNVLLTPHGVYQNDSIISGPLMRKQNQAAIRSLDLLRRVLQNKCL